LVNQLINQSYVQLILQTLSPVKNAAIQLASYLLLDRKDNLLALGLIEQMRKHFAKLNLEVIPPLVTCSLGGTYKDASSTRGWGWITQLQLKSSIQGVSIAASVSNEYNILQNSDECRLASL